MRKFSFDVPSSSQAVSDSLILRQTKVLSLQADKEIDLRMVNFISFEPEARSKMFKEVPTGQVLVAVYLTYLQEYEDPHLFTLSPKEAEELYQTLFDEFFDGADLEDVKMAIRMNSFPLRWSKDLDWQPFQVEREVKETVEKNW